MALGKKCDNFLTFDLVILHALLAVSMPNILLVVSGGGGDRKGEKGRGGGEKDTCPT